jgi:VWFA-related protein
MSVALALFAWMLTFSPMVNAESPPDSGIIEKIESQLLQIDLTVRGPSQALARLTADDFEVVISGRPIEEFQFDPLCVAPPTVTGETNPAAPQSIRAEGAGLSLMFFFDQFHLKADGRENSLRLARELVLELIDGRNQAMIVSSAREVRAFTDWTSDRAVLLDALDRLERDPIQFDEYASMEDMRIQNLVTSLQHGASIAGGIYGQLRDQEGDLKRSAENWTARAEATRQRCSVDPLEDAMMKAAHNAIERAEDHIEFLATLNKGTATEFAEAMARDYQREEQYHARRGTARLATIFDRFTGIPMPKAVIYFGDTMRANPGDHYMRLLPIPELERAFKQVFTTSNSPQYERVINEAVSRGVRIYSVQAEGLTAEAIFSASVPGYAGLGTDPLTQRARFDDAKSGLSGFALETGGRAFFGGTDVESIARKIRDDLTCAYLISFSPDGLPTDRPLNVQIFPQRPKLRVQYRARAFVRTASGRVESELTGAFVTADASSTENDLRVVVIPTGFKSGKYTALVQVVVHSALPSATWDLGFTLVSRQRAKEAASGRLSVNTPAPVVLESEMRFSPGPYEIIAVAHERTTDRLIRQRSEGQWPDADDAPASIGPIVLLQPARGAFVRDGQVRLHGSLGHDTTEWIRPELPTGLLGIVCRSRGNKKPLTVSRRLGGASSAEFDPLTIDATEERCAVFNDLVLANTMTSGRFDYEVRVTRDETELAAGDRSFFAISSDEIQLAVHEGN